MVESKIVYHIKDSSVYILLQFLSFTHLSIQDAFCSNTTHHPLIATYFREHQAGRLDDMEAITTVRRPSAAPRFGPRIMHLTAFTTSLE